MRFQLYCRLNDAVDVYHKKLLQQLSEQFACDYLKKQELPVHFKLKSDHEINAAQLAELQSLLERFTFPLSPSPVYLQDIDLFSSQAIFANIQLSPTAQIIYQDFLARCSQLEWLTFKSFENPIQHFHYLLAYQYPLNQGRSIVDFLKPRVQFLEASFDNITLSIFEENKEGIDYWQEIASYPFTAGVVPDTFTTSSTKSSKTK